MSYKYFIPNIDEEWDQYWKKTDIDKEIQLTNTDGLQSIFQRFLPKKGKILEAGCGMGKWVVVLSKLGYDITGVDNNQYALRMLKKSYPKAKTKQADIMNLPFQEKEFDAYLSLGVVEHFEKGPQQAISEAFRVLKQNGIAIVEVPFDSPLRITMRYLEKIKSTVKVPARLLTELFGLRSERTKLEMKFYEYRYTKVELINFMKEAGFENISIFPKDDIASTRSIALWLDFPQLQKKKGANFELNSVGQLIKATLKAISPFSHCALIVAVGKKKS